jgi:hypothetical protein
VRPLELVIAVGGENEDSGALDLSGEQPEHIERGLVRPVDVLEHEDGRSPGVGLSEQRRGEVVRAALSFEHGSELAPRVVRDVREGPQWPGREERVAGSREDPDVAVQLVAELLHDGCLADPCLARDQHEPTASTSRLGERIPQLLEHTVPLEQARLLGRRSNRHRQHRCTSTAHSQASKVQRGPRASRS